MVDRYTKIVLTVIALALVALVVRPWLEPSQVGAQTGLLDKREVQDVRVVGGALEVRGAIFQPFPVNVRVVGP